MRIDAGAKRTIRRERGASANRSRCIWADRPNADDVIDSKSIERALHEKPASTFSQRALDASSRRVVKHSVVIAGHRTSVSLEDAFWRALKDIAAQEGVSLAALIARIDAGRGDANLSSTLRVFVLERAQRAHLKVGGFRQ